MDSRICSGSISSGAGEGRGGVLGCSIADGIAHDSKVCSMWFKCWSMQVTQVLRLTPNTAKAIIPWNRQHWLLGNGPMSARRPTFSR